MVSTITEFGAHVIEANALVDIIAVLLLVTLLVMKEFARAGGGRAADVARALNISIGPLLLACAIIAVIRFIEIL